ncbi:MAG: AEC family transporter [Hydrogenophilales bacterium CG17_big_fil_post_rev_8_21_14_2_50_63_12]|nr:MAG: AEC family transporter [Hydrogenophilales bacterium CG17_big_fil_post_rev_8_21_14_2_50_63_12]PIX98103.1 MAG: AEC family transporter [Hydrogenophilales bacterium CG_4_10_14_3_um_filter_63_21]
MTPDFLLQLLLQVWLPIALLVAAGGAWVRFRPEFPADALRVNLNRLVIDVFAPPLLFALSAQATISRELLTIPLLTLAGIGFSFALLYPLLWHTRLGRDLKRETRAAILLAGSFGNVLFMGYPTLTFLYGDLGGSYAAFADVLASTPLVWTFGVWVATRLGHEGGHGHSLFRTVLSLPPIWGFVLGFAVNLSGLEVAPLIKAAKFMGQATIPIMLFTLGLSIPWGNLKPTRPVLAAVAVKLLIAPLLVYALARASFSELRPAQVGAILETAMPTMLMAASFADRFHLDVRAAALTASWSSLLFLLTLPGWIALLR